MKRGNSNTESGTYIDKHTKGKLYGGTGRTPDTSQGIHGATRSSERLGTEYPSEISEDTNSADSLMSNF